MTLRRRLQNIVRTHILLEDQQHLIKAQSELINDYQEHVSRMKLEHARELQGMVAGWLIALEKPEIDIRDDLVELERQLGAHIAVLEEHVVS